MFTSRVGQVQPLVEIARKTAVRQQLESARLATDEVIAHRALRRHGGDIALESSLRGARASAALMGVDVDLEFLRSGNLRLDHPGRPIAQAALRVAQEVPQIEAIWRRSPVQALARLHVVAAADLAESVGTDRIGRPRPNDEGDPQDSMNFALPPVADIAPRLMRLNALLLNDKETPALALAAYAHGELMAIQPFGLRDGLVARAAERLVLRTRGFDPRGLVVTEAGHLSVGRTQYLSLIAGFATGSDRLVADWINHCAHAVRTGAATIEKVCIQLESE